MSRPLPDAQLFHGILPYIESLPGSCAVKLNKKLGVSVVDVTAWEDTHQVTLPNDLKRFLATSDGIQLQWSTNFHGEVEEIGCIEVKSLHEMSRTQRPGHYHTFVLHDCRPYGSVHLTMDAAGSSVQFLEHETGEWTFLAPSFSAYFRLQLSCLGIHGWQMGYTQHGWPVWTMNWMYFYTPEIASIISKARHCPARSLVSSGAVPKKVDIDRVLKTVSVCKDAFSQEAGSLPLSQLLDRIKTAGGVSR
ncbi:Tubulin polyglutamylase complex subunit 2 [Kappamyces sp. JEL0680]|nr:Tubulin polyglutamylase complex subunit 2 [Kappamyces sp. JEL0680]